MRVRRMGGRPWILRRCARWPYASSPRQAFLLLILIAIIEIWLIGDSVKALAPRIQPAAEAGPALNSGVIDVNKLPAEMDGRICNCFGFTFADIIDGPLLEQFLVPLRST